jgi:serine-type D-Ala-D-Ala carboxypeptidase
VAPTTAQIKTRLGSLLDNAVREGIFPGAAAGFALGPPAERRLFLVTAGATGRDGDFPPVDLKTCFDLASLTKPLATTLTSLCLLKEGQVALNQPLSSLLGRGLPAEKRALTLRHLLGHTSGLPAHRPYFEKLVLLPPAERRNRLRQWLLAEPLLYEPGRQGLYSDLDFMLLGLLLEEITGQRLEEAVTERVLLPLGLQEDIFYQPLGETRKEKTFAATENCPWRRRVLVGEVHDDNAHALGGVAGHAGLFGTVGGVLTLALHLLDVRQQRASHPRYRPEQLRECLTTKSAGSTLVLGFDTPAPTGSSAGRYFSPASIGHLGFTGTSFWLDPEKELAVVLLTNRVHPARGNDRIKSFRPLFHDLVVESLGLAEQKD